MSDHLRDAIGTALGILANIRDEAGDDDARLPYIERQASRGIKALHVALRVDERDRRMARSIS